MAITLNHMIVPARDKEAAAHFFADLFGLQVGRKSPGSGAGNFAVVQVGEVNFDLLGRVKAQGRTYAADAVYRYPGEINGNEGGRGVYFRTPDGHNLELLTRIQQD